MKIYYAYVEEFKRFMRFFRHFYPELYDKYKTSISMPEKGMSMAVIKQDARIRTTARQVLIHIITEFYSVRYN